MARRADNENDSILEKILKGIALYKASRGIFRFASGPLALSGIAYYLYRRYKSRGLPQGAS